MIPHDPHMTIYCHRHAASLLDANHPAATAHCALAKKIATDQCKRYIILRILVTLIAI